ncbi:hypothetical protein DV704_09835 [Meiothermus sp. QL-1]|uniref:hypothetical protein n=1 Tax=Meiothermus sp. QL-1 TaxID=2058095 RepID=UPI000E0A9A5E|nr:hypothetical protein [Meiothermus sp. QL-1]RDI94950.1 hypothetical protein DV704_09835 [Meiothermus sp. QL-1]
MVYLLLSLLSLGLLAPAGFALARGRWEGGRVGLAVALQLLPWALALWKPSVATGLLWLAALAVVQAWLGRFWPGVWTASLTLVFGQLGAWTGLLLGFLLLTPLKDPLTPWLAGGLLLTSFLLAEAATVSLRKYRALD